MVDPFSVYVLPTFVWLICAFILFYAQETDFIALSQVRRIISFLATKWAKAVKSNARMVSIDVIKLNKAY